MLHTPATTARHPLSMCFLCVENAARSQMAEALARSMLDPQVEIFSAGSEPGQLDPHAIRVMAEIGIDISQARPKSFAQVPLERVATLVVMCPWEAAPTVTVPTRILHWGIANPVEGGNGERNDEVVARYRRTRDRIAYRLRSLLAELELRASLESEMARGCESGTHGRAGLHLAAPAAFVAAGLGRTPGAGFGM